MVRLRIDKNNVEFPMFDPSEHLPESEERVLAAIDIVKTCQKYLASRENYFTTENDEILEFCHFWHGHWEDDKLNKVVVIGWLPSPKIILLS